MRFSDGFWQTRPGVDACYAAEAYDLADEADRLVVTAPTRHIGGRGDTLNVPVLTVAISSPLENVLRVRITHHGGGPEPLRFAIAEVPGAGDVEVGSDGGSITSGHLRAQVQRGAPWQLVFVGGQTELTSSALSCRDRCSRPASSS